MPRQVTRKVQVLYNQLTFVLRVVRQAARCSQFVLRAEMKKYTRYRLGLRGHCGARYPNILSATTSLRAPRSESYEETTDCPLVVAAGDARGNLTRNTVPSSEVFSTLTDPP